MYEIINEVRITGNIQGAPELRSRKLEDGKIEYSTRGTLSQVRRTWTDEDGYIRHSYNMYQFRAKGEVAEKICKRFSAGLMVIVLGSLLDSIIGLLPQILDAGIQLIVWLANGIVNSLPNIISGAGEVLVTLLDTILSGLGSMLDSGSQLIGSMSNGLIQNIPAIVSSIGSVLSKLLATIVAHLPQLLQSGVQLLASIASGIVSYIPSILSVMVGVVADLWNAIKEVDWLGLGSDILSGIASGITSGLGVIVEAAKNAAKAALEAAKSFLGIHSPSTVFRDQVGAMMAEGMGEGFVENAPTMEIQKTVKGVVEDARDATVSPYNMGITSPANNDTQSIKHGTTEVWKKMTYFFNGGTVSGYSWIDGFTPTYANMGVGSTIYSNSNNQVSGVAEGIKRCSFNASNFSTIYVNVTTCSAIKNASSDNSEILHRLVDAVFFVGE